MRRKRVGIRADIDRDAETLKGCARRVDGRANHFGLTAIEQQGFDAEFSRHRSRFGYRLTGAQAWHFIGVFILEGERQPERFTVLRQPGVNGPRLDNRTLGFRQPQINMRGQPIDQRRQQLGHAIRFEQIWTIRTKQRRQRPGNTHWLAGCLHRPPRQLPRQCRERLALSRKARLANVKRHHRVTVAGDHVGAAVDVRGMHRLDRLRRFTQRQCRPLRLAKRCAGALQLAAHAAIENDPVRCAHMLFTHMLMKITHYQSRSYNYLIRTTRLITTSFFNRKRL